MAQTKTIQLLRSSSVYASASAAKTAVAAMTGQDGEIRIARYNAAAQGENEKIQSMLCIYHATPDLPSGSGAGWTFIEDVSNQADSPAALRQLIETVITGAGLNNDGTYTAKTDDPIVDDADSINAAVEAIINYLKGLDVSARNNASTDGKVVVTISQADGEVSETTSDLTDVKMGGYSKTADAGAIAATDTLEQAFSKVENAISSTTVKSTDKTVIITDNSGKDLAVNIDGTTIVKDSSTGVLSADLTVAKLNATEVTALSDANVKEAYKLIYATDANRTAIGDVVKIYKDSALQNVYMGHFDDTLSGQDASTHESSSSTVVPGTGDDALCFVYQLANGNYKLEAVNVQAFLKETEFKDGLTVDTSNHTVSVKVGNGLELGTVASDGNKPVQVKIDSTSEKDSQSTPVDFLSVSSNGVKVSGIKDEIDRKIADLDADLDASGTAQHSGTFVMSGVTEVDGVITSVDSVEVEAAGAAAAAKATIDAYKVNNKAISSNPTLDGGDINVDDSAGTPETVAAAIARLETAATGAKTVVAEGTDSGNNMLIVKTTDLTTGADTYTINLTGIAQDADVVKSVNGETPTSGAVTLDGADIALTGYAKGTAPASLDVAATDTVNGAIAKLEHQIDAAEAATTDAIGNLDGAATATAADSNGDFAVLTKVNEVDGVIQAVGTGANSSTEVTLKKVAGTGAAADVSIADAGGIITATTVEGALQEIAGKANGALQSVSGSNAITVGAEDANHDQSISLKLDTSTGNAVTSGTTTEMLVITSNGLAMNDTWDCGVF